MNNLQNIRFAVTILQEQTGTISTLKQFSVIRDNLDELVKNDVIIDNNEDFKYIFELANLQLGTAEFNLQQIVLVVLNLILKCNFTNHFIYELPTIYFQLAFNGSNQIIRSVAYKYLHSFVKFMLTNDIYDVESVFLMFSNKTIKDGVHNLLIDVYSDLPIKKSTTLFYEKNVCCMFENSNEEVRNSLIKLNNCLLPKFKITLLDNEDLKKHKFKVRQSYIPKIVALRCAKDLKWSKLYKFILKSFGKALHGQVDIINDLLKTVESAFRSSKLEDRYQAFDCWKELIDNYSLDMNRICGSKEMKLLLTPLKTNISTNEHIISKRFEVWIHLLNILQDKAFNCLEQFLQFCFGNGINDNSNLENTSLYNQNFQLFEDIMQAFLEILGHHHQNNDECHHFSNCNLKFHQPLVTDDNFLSVSHIVIFSVGKCSTMILQCMTFDESLKVIYCLWASLFSKLKKASESQQEQLLQDIISILQSFAQTTNEISNSHLIVSTILKLWIKEDFFSKPIFIKWIFFPVLKCLLNNQAFFSLIDIDIVNNFIECGKDYTNTSSWTSEALDIITHCRDDNFQIVVLLWIACVDFLSFIGEDVIVEFITWPFLRCDTVWMESNKEFAEKWKTSFRSTSNMYPTQVSSIIEKIQNLSAQKNASFICLVYKVFYEILQKGNIEGFETALIRLTEHLLQSFTLRKTDASLLLPTITSLFTTISQSRDALNFTSLCNCCTILLQIYKKFKLLDTLEEIIDKMSLTFPTSFKTTINELKNCDNTAASLKIDAILQKLNAPDNKTVKIMSTTPRGRKLITMTKRSSPKSDPSSLILLGQNVSSPNHVDIRGSHLKTFTNSRGKKIVNKININATSVTDNSDDANFIPIDTMYEFDPKKLSEHQLDVLKSRKTDIPALYQDLSQSQSNFGSSNGELVTLDDKANKNEIHTNSSVERVNLQVTNPSEEQIEAMIKNDRDPTITDAIEDVKKRERVEKELMKLKLDLVGGEFVQNIDLLGQRKTRRKSDTNFKQYKFLKVPNSPLPKRNEISKADNTIKTEQKKSVSKTPKKPSFDETSLSSVIDTVENTTVVEVTANQTQSEDVVESSQFQDVITTDHNVFSLLNTEYEIDKFPYFEIEIIEPVSPTAVEKDINLTNENETTCNMDTETLDVCGTPKKSFDIPTSPIQVDTPTRTSELIKDTVDISPIKMTDCIEEDQEDNLKTEELFESEVTQVIPLDSDEHKVDEEIAEPEVDLQLMFFNKRFKKSLNSKPANKKIIKTIKPPLIFPAQNNRAMKMIKKCEMELELQDEVKPSICVDITSDEEDINQEFFKFVKEIPSPKASPRCSILKRKAYECLDEGLSPPRKKRVNFPDPPLTSKLMYVPDANEHTHVAVDLFENVDGVDNGEVKQLTLETCLMETETQGSVEMLDAQILNNSQPVFPDLIDCQDDVESVARFLSDSVFVQSLLDEFRNKNVRTVGDLAKLSEIEVNRFPIKSPKLVNLNDVLSKHKLQMSSKIEDGKLIQTTKEEPRNNVPQSSKQKRRVPLKAVTDSDCSVSNNFKPLLLEPILSDSKVEDKTEKSLVCSEESDAVQLLTKKEGIKLIALCRSLIDVMEPHEVFEVFQNNATFKLTSLIGEGDSPETVKDLIDKIGLKSFVKVVCGNPSVSPIDFLDLAIDTSMQLCKDKNSTKLQETVRRVIQHLNLQQILEEIRARCDTGNLSQSQFFLDAFKTFSPSIDDVTSSTLQYINLFQLHDKCEQRREDLLKFVEGILNVVDGTKVCLLIPKEKLLPLFGRQDLTQGLVETSHSRCDIIDSCKILIEHFPKPHQSSKQKRRVPLKAVTDSDYSVSNNFKPLLLEPTLSDSKVENKAEKSVNVCSEELDAVQLLTKKEGIKLIALCRSVIDVMEPHDVFEVFQNNATFKLTSLIGEGDSPEIVNDFIDKIGLKSFVKVVCGNPSVSPIDFLDLAIDTSMQLCKDKNSTKLQETFRRVIQHLNLQQILEEMRARCDTGNLSQSQFFLDAFKTFSPSIDDVTSSTLQYINLFQLHDKCEQRREDLLKFAEGILHVVDVTKVGLLIPKEKLLPLFSRQELTQSVVESSHSRCDIIDSCKTLMEQFPKIQSVDNTDESSIFALLDKIPTSNLLGYVSKRLSRLTDDVEVKEQL